MTPHRPWQRLATLAWPGSLSQWRDVPRRVRPTLQMVVRLTAAAVVAYLLTLLLTQGALDLTGPLTALLVVQASAFSTIKMGGVRVGAVLAGVLVATLLSTWVGLTWWSLGAAIAASLLLGKALRLGDQTLEAPISAMLILGVSNHDLAAETRVLNTLIGAAVGVAFNLVFPPAMPTAPAVRSLLEVAEAAAEPLDAAGHGLAAGPVSDVQVQEWIDRARAANHRVAVATDSLAALKDSRRFNARAIGAVDIEPVLSSGLDTLEHCLLAIRALFAVLLTEVPSTDEPDDPYGAELRTAFAVVLHDTADCLRAFGGLVVAEAHHGEEETERALAESLEILRETKAILTELILVNAEEDKSRWLLRGSILTAVEHVLTQLDLEDRARIRREWRERQQQRLLSQLSPLVRGVLPHGERPFPRRLDRHELMVWTHMKSPADASGSTPPSERD